MVKKIGIIVGVAVLVCLTIFFITVQTPDKITKNIDSLVEINIAAMPHSFTGYTIFLADKKGYFREQGLDVKIIKTYPHGKATLNALTTGEAQLAASSETPFIHSILKGDQLCTVAITITADEHLALVARKDKNISIARDLKDKKIGVTVGSNGEYFLDMVLNINGLSSNHVKIIDLKPPQMVKSLLAEDVDAIVTWNPQKIEAIKKLGENAAVFDAEGLYSPLFILASTKDFAKTNPEMLRKVLRALLSATEFIQNNQEKSHKIVAKEIVADPVLLTEMSASYNFKISLEQSFLTTLENQSYWALRRKDSSEKEIPDYLNYIYLDGLQQVSPASVTIIR